MSRLYGCKGVLGEPAKSWHLFRFIKSKYTMSSLVELMAELSTTCYSIGSCHWVEVTHINTPDDFYVRPTAYKSHLRKLEVYEGPITESKLKPGGVVVFKSQTKKRYVRGQIRNIRDDGNHKICDMFALDYGFSEAVPVEWLNSPKREGMPALAVRCQLELCQPKGKEFDKKAVEAMIYFVGDEAAKMIVRGKTADKLTVQLLNSCPDDISTMLAYSEVSSFGFGPNTANRMTCTNKPKFFYKYKKVQVGDSFPVRVQSGDSLQNFYVSDVKEFREYVAEFSQISSYLRLETEMRPEDVKVGKPVAVHTGYKYERAVIKEVTVPEEKAIVQLVDCGKVIEINMLSSRLKALEREYYFLQPALAIYCTADEKQAWDNGLQRFLYPGYEFLVTVLKVGKDHETPNVVSLARIEG
ncbi:tudor domain-containing 6-like [Choristoneura fumiferana]|uniref:tudor domain-containing 6-like n=1 Tax=Choristoneura fumiferana TaxID=7141 RepID=UPI003D154A86